MNITPIEIDGDLVLSLAASVSATINSDEDGFDYYIDLKTIEINLKRQ